MRYWAVGINEKINDKFLSKNIWWTDYPDSQEEGIKLRKWIKKRVNIGDKVALKTRNIKGKSLKIFAIGTVTKKFDDYSGFHVTWEKVNPPRITNSTFGQTSTMRQVNDEGAINEIFGLKYKGSKNKVEIKNIILYGVAGVGKTHNTNQLIKLIEDRNSEQEIFSTIQNNKYSENMDISDIKKRVKFITFHQSFGYEDFIEGFRPNKEGKITLIDGIFKEICKEAIANREENYYLVIDEINRGNISKIFGELITLIEEDKRDKLEVTLPYSKESFSVPSNLYIIGTMNSSDKSIALIDIALRRRFTFLKMKPNSNLIEYSKAKEIFKKLNEYISTNLSEDYQIGHSYFINIENNDDLKFVLKYKIEPLLEEYFYGDDRLTEAKKIYGENL